MDNKKLRLIAVVGPTASGKTALAVRLAKHYGGEVISADSMQIYKSMDIATAKPTAEEMDGVRHHLIGFLDPGESFSVSDFVGLAHSAAADIAARGRFPVLCGGTGLYVRSLLENISFTEEKSDPVLREMLEERYHTEGGQSLIDEIAVYDPQTASLLHPSNRKRIIRAIEIYRTTGKTMSEQISASRDVPSPYDTIEIGLTFSDRNILYDRINRRVDIMLGQGLVEEARRFFAMETGKTAAAAIGYKELRPYLDGELSLEEAVEHLKQETRHYAKRQLTWFRRDRDVHWIEADKSRDVFEDAVRIIDSIWEKEK